MGEVEDGSVEGMTVEGVTDGTIVDVGSIVGSIVGTYVGPTDDNIDGDGDEANVLDGIIVLAGEG